MLGDSPPGSAMHVTTEIDSYSGAIYARNLDNGGFPERVGFFDVDDARRTVSCDRAEFVGRAGSLEDPAALTRTHLSGRVDSGWGPYAAIQLGFDLADGRKARTSSSTPGTTPGIDGPGSDDGTPLGSGVTANGVSIRLRRAGPRCPARAVSNAFAWPRARWMNIWFAVSTPLSGCSIPRLTKRTWNLATSRATCGVCARTVAVHAWRYLGGHGVCHIGRKQPRVGTSPP